MLFNSGIIFIFNYSTILYLLFPISSMQIRIPNITITAYNYKKDSHFNKGKKKLAIKIKGSYC